MISLVKEKIVKIKKQINNFRFMEAGYKKGNDVPLFSDINSVSFGREDFWGGKADSHAWFYKKITVPKEQKGIRLELSIKTQKNTSIFFLLSTKKRV